MGVDAATAAKHFSEPGKTWKGHGRKVRLDVRSTTKLLEDETKTTEDTTLPDEQAVYAKEFAFRNAADKMILSD